MTHNDTAILRELAQRYAEIAALPVQEEKRKLWTSHFALEHTRIPVLATFGMHNVWCRDVFGDANMKCADPFLRGYERALRMLILQHEVGDDSIQEPWVTFTLPFKSDGHLWGLPETMRHPGGEGNAARYEPSLKTWDDLGKLRATPHEADAEKMPGALRNLERLEEILGGILAINVQQGVACMGFNADISTSLAKLRGLEQLMVDMHESPRELHGLLAFMRDGILANQQAAEDAGHFALTSAANQQAPYARGLEPLKPNSGPRGRGEIWGFCAAQEYALVSPAFHEEFMFQYQRPICERFGLVHYGCCEDLGEKITMLRKLKNLRSVAVAPLANVRRCAEQARGDCVLSWRPNPTDMVCCGYNGERVEKIIRKAMDDSAGCFMHIHLKDVETLEGDIPRLGRWVRKAREVTAG